MIREIKSGLVFGGLLSTPLFATNSDLTITVFAYNYTRISSDLLAQTEAKVSQIYRRCGIEFRWVSCPLSPAELRQFPDCRFPAGRTWLVVRILSRPMAERARRSRDVLGFVFTPKDGSFAEIANISADGAQRLASSRAISMRVVLGYAIAHEIGHLLLGPDSHGSSGIMKCPWHPGDLESIARGFISFTPHEVERMRANVRARVTDEEAKRSFVRPP